MERHADEAGDHRFCRPSHQSQWTGFCRAPADRIATFDNDGTLWVEQPMDAQMAFSLDRVKALAPLHPEWDYTDPFQSVLDET
jgi:hypothetical protein